MPKINLLPVKQARKRVGAKNEMFVLLGIQALVVVGIVAWHTSMESEVTSLQEKMQTVDSELQRLNLDVAKLQDFKSKEDTIQKKLQVINQLMVQKTGPAKMLDELATILTNDAKHVWLTALQENAGNMRLLGGGMEHEDISEFELALERSKYFHDVKLTEVKVVKDADTSYLGWSITCVVRYGAG